MFVVTGVANAINIIDGFNGLASMCVLMMMLALAYVAFQVGDTMVFTAALIAPVPCSASSSGTTRPA